MTRLLRGRTISVFLTCSGLMSYVISPAYAQVAAASSTTPATGSSGSLSTGTSPAPTTNYSGTNVIDFGNQDGGTLVFKGDLINHGTLYAISTNPTVHTAIFSAVNIFNQPGATISSVLPAGGLPGYANAIGGFSLVFNATNNFVNAGTISSAGSLAINAAGTITNALPTGVNAPVPVMQAINNIDIASQIGSIVNAGTIASAIGNINLTAAAANAFAINNVGGVMQALQGNINIRDSLFTGTSSLNIIGGDWLCKNLDLSNGNGLINAQLGSVSGVIDALGSGAQIGVNKGDLLLGNIKVYGDPTYYSAAGNVSLPANIDTLGFDLAVVAKNDIVGTGSSVAITTGAAASSGNVLMVAGAKITSPSSGTDGPPGSNATKVTWTSPNSLTDAGGSIFITTLTIDTSGTANHKAGDVTLVAYQGTNALSGQIVVDMKTSLINASNANSSFSGGNVLLIAGATSGNPLVFGNITGGGSTANIQAYAATPVISGPGTITVLDGTPQPGSGTYTASQLQNARIDLGDLKNDGAIGLDSVGLQPATAGAKGGAITVQSAGDVNINSLFSRGGQGGADIAGTAPGAGGDGGIIDVHGNAIKNLVVDTSGGKGGPGLNNASSSGNGGAGGNGGFYFATGASSLTVGTLTSNGGDGGTGGTLGTAVLQGAATGGTGGSAILVAQDVFTTNDVNLNGGAGGSAAKGDLGGNGSGGGKGGGFIVTANNFQASAVINVKGGSASSAADGTALDGGSALGPGGAGGSVQITTSQQITVNGIDTSGGAGGNGGNAGNIVGSFAGQSSAGGAGGSTNLKAGTALSSGDFLSKGGIGGNGGSLFNSFSGGQPGGGSDGGKGGTLTLSGVACCLANMDVSGGAGGNAGSQAGTGAFATGGKGGTGGSVSATSSDNLDVLGSITADGGIGGAGTSAALDGAGGNGGTVTLNQNVLLSPPPTALPALISGSISAKGYGAGNQGGTVTLTSTLGFEIDQPIFVSGSRGAAGGTVTINAANLTFQGVDQLTGASIDASSDKAAGGKITVTLPGTGPGCGCPNEIFGSINANGAGVGNKAGTISLSAPAALFEVDGSISAAGKNNASGGFITVLADAFAILGTDPITGITMDASGTTGGSISATANSAILPSIIAGEVNVNGSGPLETAGSVTLNSKGAFLEIDGPIKAIGQGGLAYGGSISITAVELALSISDPLFGVSLDVSGISGGSITVLTTGPNPLSNGGCSCNLLEGYINADGLVNGGRINLGATGGFDFSIPTVINARSTSPGGQGGLIQFTSPGSAILVLKNEGGIVATNVANNSGRVGFNVGDTGGVNISGGGGIVAGEYVGIGALNPVTLDIQNSREVNLSDFPIGNYSLTQGGGVSNKILISQPLSPTPSSSTTSTTTLTGGISVQFLPLDLSGSSSSSTILKTDQIQFVFSVADLWQNGPKVLSKSYIDGVLVNTLDDALTAKGVEIAANGDGKVVLNRGNLLIMPGASIDGGMEITTNEGTLFVAPGSIAFLIETGNDVAVYALHEAHRGDITFRSGKQTIELATGQQAVFTRSNTDFSQVNPGTLIPARKVNSYKLANGVTAYIADYSLPIALSVIRPLKDMRESDKASLHRACGTVQKNAAILSLIGSKYGPYKPSK